MRNSSFPRRRSRVGISAAFAFAPVGALTAQAQEKLNILVIFGDDVGVTNISAYSGGLMGYETPNIERIAKEGVLFQHYYGEQSCTAGRAAGLRRDGRGLPVRGDLQGVPAAFVPAELRPDDDHGADPRPDPG